MMLSARLRSHTPRSSQNSDRIYTYTSGTRLCSIIFSGIKLPTKSAYASYLSTIVTSMPTSIRWHSIDTLKLEKVLEWQNYLHSIANTNNRNKWSENDIHRTGTDRYELFPAKHTVPNSAGRKFSRGAQLVFFIKYGGKI